MKNILHIVLTILMFFVSMKCSLAQIDLQCDERDMHSIYLIAFSGYYRIDSVDTSPTSMIFLTNNALGNYGISINNNLDSLAGPVTMYSCYNYYYYWNGSGWTSTNHSTGISSAANPGGSSNFIFNLDDWGTGLYRYDGNSSSLLLSNVGTGADFVHDVATDNQGNFYLFFTNAQIIVCYTFNGIPIDTFLTTGFVPGSQCGITILGNRFYASSCNELYEGIKTGNTFHFTMIMNLNMHSSDIASCPKAAYPLAVFKDPDQPHFVIYSNPVHDIALIKLNNTAKLEIYDRIGNIKMIISTNGLTEYQLDVHDWKAGVYIINAVSDKYATTRGKLVVN